MNPTATSLRSAAAGYRERSPHGERPTVEDFGHRSDVLKRANVIRFTVAAMAAVVALSVPLAPDAQPTARPVKIGVLCAGGCPFSASTPRVDLGGLDRPLIDALERVGLVQGRSLVWDIGGVVASENQINTEAVKLVSRRPDLILVWANNVAAARAAKDATHTIPIVLMAVPDAVEHGLVASLARPGGNITGTSVPLYDLTIKQLEVLKEINPRLKRIVVVHGELDRPDRQMMDRLRGAAASLQLEVGITVTDLRTDLRNVEQALAAAPAGASTVVTIGNIPTFVERRIRQLALERKLPLISPWRSWGTGTTVIAYGPRFSAVAERTAALVDRIVKGARPGDLPVEELTSYELVIDGVMAKALGLTIPPAVRARADQVLD
jgi:putative tryptophan/tyrosine transport system substrate-binding protein